MGLFGLTMATLSAFAFSDKGKSTNEALDCQYGQCTKIKSDGYRCRNCAQQGSSYCWSHR
jgi:hypothetical protein